MGSPIVSPPDPWSATGLNTVPVQQPDPWAATGLKTVPVDHAAAGGSWTPTVGEEIEQSSFGTAHPWIAGVAGTIANLGAGALKGIGSDIRSIGAAAPAPEKPLTIRAEGKTYTVPPPQPSLAARAIRGADLTPHGTAQKLGAATENIAEGFLLPEVKASLPIRLGAQALMGAGLSKAHGGSALAGAAGGLGAEAVGSGLRAVAPTLAEAGIGARAVDRAYDKTPGLALLNDTRGLRPAKIAATSRESLGRLNSEIDQMAADASRPTVMGGAPARLALPPGPVEREAVPLHPATAVVERPSIIQPAGVHEPTFAQGTDRALSPKPRPVRDASTGRMAQQEKPPLAPNFITSPASAQIPSDHFAAFRSPAQSEAADFLSRLEREGGNGVTYPNGRMQDGAITHPLKEPLRTIRREEPAQGVWLRAPEGPVHVAPTTPEQAGFTLHQPTVSLRPALDRLDEMIAKVPENSPTELNSLRKVRGGLTTNLQGEQIPADVSPARALALKRGLRKEFAKYRGDPTFDANVASNASKEASHDIDTVLDRALGPEFASKNQRISSLIDVNKLASRASRNAPLGQRIAGRLAAHTGALTGAGIGSVLGYRKGGLEGAAAGGAAGLLLPEALASRPALIGAARAANSPLTKRLLRGALVGGATAATRK